MHKLLHADRNSKRWFDVAWGPCASFNNHRMEPGDNEASEQRVLLGCPSPSPALWIVHPRGVFAGKPQQRANNYSKRLINSASSSVTKSLLISKEV